MTKTALLILVGGRQVPNLLTAQFLKPDIICPIASEQGKSREWSSLEPALRSLGSSHIEPPTIVDAFGPQDIQAQCQAAVARHPDAEWIFNITCGTAIMSIGAYEAAKQCAASAWYLDTATQQVVCLHGKPAPVGMFDMTVEKYLAVYGRSCLPTAKPEPHYVECARRMGNSPGQSKRLIHAMDRVKGGRVHLPAAEKPLRQLCRFLAAKNLLNDLQESEKEISFLCPPAHQAFFTSPQSKWLEIFVWDCAGQLGCFEDWQFGVNIPNLHLADNEVDLMAVSLATLLIAECKTDFDPFKGKVDYLNKLHTVSNMIGGNYVGRLYITLTSQPREGQPMFESYKRFCGQAAARQIVVVTGEKFKHLSSILKKEAGANFADKPTFARG